MFRHHKLEKKVETPKNSTKTLKTEYDIAHLSELALKQFKEVPLPKYFLDPLTFELFVDPVITPYGHIYSQHSILRHLSEVSVDPLTSTRLVLTRGQLYQAPEVIQAMLKKLNILQNETKKALLNDPISAAITLETYCSRLILLGLEMEAHLEKLIIQGTIKTIKNNLKIDSSNKDHVDFWQGKGKLGQNIPDHVRNMMEVAKEHYDSVEDFLYAINDERRLSSSSQFFKHCFRSNVTLELYKQSDENIRSFVVRD